MHRLNVTIELKNGNERDIEIAVSDLVIFVWTGRNTDIIKKEVEELSRIGISGPKNIPEIYVLQPYLVTTSNYIRRVSDLHSGEVEYVLLVKNEDEIYVTVGSDHTDREAERCSVLAGKHMYPKIVARRAWPLRDIKDHWDELVLRSWILEDDKKTLYQEGTTKFLLTPEKLVDLIREVVPDLKNVVVFSGTIPTIKGQIKPSGYFEIELHDPVLNRSINHYYWIE
ncbi:DUF2848 family protein [Vulcanisaeta souniana]|uniref:DUF2848 domain-containing protein n=1 Tax=Vulcanisaeta souniana JCM 11219 TaxID=1293586 RepID=A0A830DZU5_9CREN|nr:DUF2848 family protein [Vulcanisaeta souniana]BDR92005.1 hypothetical protein Vsou_10980 [Vulcanisaeta souniana JCM 11219]GGI68643.1 hypothetical protein GCM10007112_02060 [Vulcanisaeta souniana JCM 11219]